MNLILAYFDPSAGKFITSGTRGGIWRDRRRRTLPMDAVTWQPSQSDPDVPLAGNPDSLLESFTVKFDSGSFRDRTSRVFLADGEIYRTLNAESHADWRRASVQPFFQELMTDRRIIATDEVASETFQQFQFPVPIVGALRHERVPFISYPYEWSFGMLRQAALLHLQILRDAVKSGLILKDASPYNVQFVDAQPIFIDVGSFTQLAPGEPWVAYRQFCELMLFPLLLQSYRGVHFQPILRGQLEGISARQFLQWMRWRDMFRPGVLTNGWLQAALEQKTQSVSTSTVRDLQSSGFQSSMIEQMLSKLTRLVERLDWTPQRTQWTHYNDSLPHVADDGQFKSEFVESVCRAKPRQLVWDLGCNEGRYSRIASEFADLVVAMDQDHACIDRLYKSLPGKWSNILPLCVELANASPAQGWRGHERKRLEDRGRPDLILCLGLIHHLVLASNIPLPEVVDWLASFGAELILEFPSKQDAMVVALLRNKRDQYADYAHDCLEFELKKRFEIRRCEPLPSGERTMYHAVPRATADATT